MNTIPTVMLRPVVRFREFPFGTKQDRSMREFMSECPWENQDKVVSYLRSGLVMGVSMGADLVDPFDPSAKANPVIESSVRGGVTEMTDGVWFWYAGLIYFIEKYHVRVPQRFVEHASRQNWHVDQAERPVCRYEWSYFDAVQPMLSQAR